MRCVSCSAALYHAGLYIIDLCYIAEYYFTLSYALRAEIHYFICIIKIAKMMTGDVTAGLKIMDRAMI